MNEMDENVRQRIVRVCRILDGMGLVEGFGHVSARGKKDAILLTPARGLALVSEPELLTFDVQGRLLEGQEGSAPLERWMHFAIYRARPDVHAICRTHSRMAVLLGAARTGIRPVHGFGAMLGASVPVHDVNDLITTDAMGKDVAQTLGDAVAVLLRGNGGVVTGATLQQACVRAIYLEEAAFLQAAAAATGGAPAFTADELAARQRWHEVEAERAWEYYSRKFADSTSVETPKR